MDRGLYIAATGMLAEFDRQNALSNNLANITTAGYKADDTTQRNFDEVLLEERSSGRIVGTTSAGPMTAHVTRMSQGVLNQTDNPLDVAIVGDGFLSVRDRGQVSYTRNGQLTTNAQGQLTDAQGRQVMSRTGAPIQVGSDLNAVAIGQDGVVTVAGRRAGQLALTNLQNPVKTTDSLFRGRPAGQATGEIRQGSLETSNTDPTQTVIDMIASQRTFEAGQRTLRTIDETLQRAAQLAQVS